MSIISPVDRDLAVVYSPLMPVPFREWLCERGIRLVEVPDDEFDSMGTNVLALAPRRCVMVDGQSRHARAARSGGRRRRDLRRIGDQPEGRRRPDVPDAAAGARRRYPCRRIVTGSIRVARQDGTTVATSPTPASSPTTTTAVSGSVGATPNSSPSSAPTASRRPAVPPPDQSRSGAGRPARPSRPGSTRRRPSPCGCRSRAIARERAATARRRR